MLYALLTAPFAAALIVSFGSGRDGHACSRTGILLSLAIAALGVPLITCMPNQSLSHDWFTLWGTGASVHFSLSADGLSAWLVQLVTFLTPVAILASKDLAAERMREFVATVLVMEGLMIAALLASDLVLFYISFEAMLIPMLILICLFGGQDRRRAALQFLLYTMFGSIFMLVGIWYIALKLGTTDIARVSMQMVLLPTSQQLPLFFAFALAFAVKVPLFPLHGWQARAYAEAPSGGALLLAGAMAKLGTYGFLRFVLPFFPALSGEYAWLFITLGLISVLYGALMAISQSDVKRMLAFSSLSHLGLIVVGIFSFSATAASGAAVQMVAHGLSVAAMFLLVGYLENRASKREIMSYGGLANRAPLFATCFVIAALATAALPGTANFAGEFMLLFGIFRALPKWVAAAAGLSTILGAIYLLRVVQRWLYGPVQPGVERIHDLNSREFIAVAPLLVLAFVFGMYPAPIARQAGKVAEQLTSRARERAIGAAEHKPADTAEVAHAGR